MAKKQSKADEVIAAGSYTLKPGHQTEFRRTVILDGSSKAGPKATDPERVQLTFRPGEHVELSDVEVAGVQDLIDAGLLVPSEEYNDGRIAPQPASPHTDSDSVIAKLEAKVEEQAAELSILRAERKAPAASVANLQQATPGVALKQAGDIEHKK